MEARVRHVGYVVRGIANGTAIANAIALVLRAELALIWVLTSASCMLYARCVERLRVQASTAGRSSREIG